ncbi:MULTISPECIES: hypothetical protein [Pseudomonadaceae]|nr:hypothetical protein [Halopseudomonas gallaeciensis]
MQKQTIAKNSNTSAPSNKTNVPNLPSKTGNKSGSGRGNNPAKKKS